MRTQLYQEYQCFLQSSEELDHCAKHQVIHVRIQQTVKLWEVHGFRKRLVVYKTLKAQEEVQWSPSSMGPLGHV